MVMSRTPSASRVRSSDRDLPTTKALADVKSAIRFHLETFGDAEIEDAVLEAFVAEATARITG